MPRRTLSSDQPAGSDLAIGRCLRFVASGQARPATSLPARAIFPTERSAAIDDCHRSFELVRVLVVKHDRLSAEALRHAVAQTLGPAQTQVCHTATEAVALLQASPVILGLFGLTLPDMDGLDLLTAVAEGNLVERRLVVTGRHDERTLQVLRQARIHGFFDSSADDATALGTAIRRVAEGRGFFSPTFESVRVGGSLAGADFLQQLLSETELLVYAVIGDGSDDEAAALRLGLCANTVRCHRQHIMRKLGVQSRTTLMQQAIRLGIVRFWPDRIQRPGFERALAERLSLGRNPFGAKAAQPQASVETVCHVSNGSDLQPSHG